jgi:low affinity Fe/Cu permease
MHSAPDSPQRLDKASTPVRHDPPDCGLPSNGFSASFGRFANAVTRWAGSPVAFGIAFIGIMIWALCGPIFHYSENWQLVVNTLTTIITFLMVFLIQQSQNKDSQAVHLKLNELIASHRHASDALVSIEDLDEEQLRRLTAFYHQLGQAAQKQAEAADALKSATEQMTAESKHAHQR